jgi:hypothetical protein
LIYDFGLHLFRENGMGDAGLNDGADSVQGSPETANISSLLGVAGSNTAKTSTLCWTSSGAYLLACSQYVLCKIDMIVNSSIQPVKLS